MTTQEVAETPQPDDERVATVQHLPANGWALVTYGTWQVSVGNDGLLHLPRHLTPTDVPDFIGAIAAAGEVGLKIKADNETAGAKDDRGLPSKRVIVREGPPPNGATRMPAKGTTLTGTIGRRGGNRSGQAPRGSTSFPTPTPRQNNTRGR